LDLKKKQPFWIFLEGLWSWQ